MEEKEKENSNALPSVSVEILPEHIYYSRLV